MDNVKVDGLAITRDEYVSKQLNDIFQATTVEQLIVESDLGRKKLLQLGCFKSVIVTIDASDKGSVKILIIFINYLRYLKLFVK